MIPNELAACPEKKLKSLGVMRILKDELNTKSLTGRNLPTAYLQRKIAAVKKTNMLKKDRKIHCSSFLE